MNYNVYVIEIAKMVYATYGYDKKPEELSKIIYDFVQKFYFVDMASVD